MRQRISLFALVALTTLAGCKETPQIRDPERVEFVDACMVMRSNARLNEDRRMKRCTCYYDTTTAGLNEEEKRYALFYLLGQAGIDMKSSLKGTTLNAEAMMKGARAVGFAAKSCR